MYEEAFRSPHAEVGGKILAELWLADRSPVIDLWGCDLVCRGFFFSFWDTVEEAGALEGIADIQWLFPCETGRFDWEPSYFGLMAQWFEEWREQHAAT